MKSISLAMLLACCCSCLSADTLYEAFRSPQTEHRPFVRWWWNGGRVDRAELTRELDIMKAAGIGGVEINTIGMPEGATPQNPQSHPAIEWLSPEWNVLVGYASAAARERGLTTDLIVGSGWPFGGMFVHPDEQSQRVILVKQALSGPTRVILRREELLAMEPPPRAHTERNTLPPTHRELLFLRLVSTDPSAGDGESGRDLLPVLGNRDQVAVDLPAGNLTLLVGILQRGYNHVKLGAPGADGPVVNHFDAAAVRHYLDHMASNLAPALGGRLGNALRAMFVDSLELDHANWTTDLLAEFRRRRGYDLMPYLPLVLDEDNAVTSSELKRTIRRVRYDYCHTLLELFDERFLNTYRTWAAANGVKARIQAYGRETHPLHGSMQADLPEGETWLWVDKIHTDRLRVDSTVINKYVSSAANLTGQRARSFEAMTNAVPVFRENLQDFKRALDATLIAGLNHPILHGFNYTPPDAGFPGWVRFGSYLNDRTPWWPYFRRFTDYAARLGTVMRRSEARARVAVLAPRADEWSRHGLLYQPFPEVLDPWYQFKLIDAIQQAGYNADYISDRILAEGKKSAGRLRYGPCAYEVLIVIESEAMEPAAAAGLAEFVDAGGRVIFIGAPPVRSPGLHQAAEQDRRVQEALTPLRHALPERVWQVNPPLQAVPASDAADETQLLELTRSMLAGTGLVPDMQIDRPQRQVSQITQWDGARAIYFIANSDPEDSHHLTLGFPGATGRPYRWDPETGAKRPLLRDDQGMVGLELEPTESALIVFSPDEDPAPPAARPVAPRPETGLTLRGPWRLRLDQAGGGGTSEHVLPRLVDLSQPDQDAVLRGFSGVATYVIEFETTGSDTTILDLGTVHGVSEVTLDGKLLGARWWGRHRYVLPDKVQPGRHHLQVKVATTLVNLMRGKDDSTARRWASWAPPIPNGLIGPVRLLEVPPNPGH